MKKQTAPSSADKLQTVRAWIVRSIRPDAKSGAIAIAKIGIAEVLRAFPQRICAKADSTRTFDLIDNHAAFAGENRYVLWSADLDIDHQKPEVIDFLYSLIP